SNDNRTFIINAVCRDAKINLKDFELEFAADISRTIGYLLWQKLS
ncbi:10760_t:CDS:1, partial [Entrophospora sp. SA101]